VRLQKKLPLVLCMYIQHLHFTSDNASPELSVLTLASDQMGFVAHALSSAISIFVVMDGSTCLHGLASP